MPELKFVIVGHVDHGKSTLIGRLLYDTDSLPPDRIEEMKKTSGELGRETEFAFLLDHLKEEREQGVTIDTTQTFFHTPSREYVIIDAPGHVEFVKNMVTGASQAEAAVLIIDAAEGIREQTRRHAYILSLLGISQVIVVLNKMDLAGYEEARYHELKRETGEFLESIGTASGFFIPISALKGDNIVRKGEGLDWYQGPTFLEALDSLRERVAPADLPLIFPVQDIYRTDGKRMVVGRVESGRIERGQRVRVLPGDYETAVRSVEKFNEERTAAAASESVGVTLEDSLFVERGMVICEKDRPPATTREFKATLFWMSKAGLDPSRKIDLRCATQQVSCEIAEIERRIDSSDLRVVEERAGTLENLEVGEVRIRTKKPIAVERFQAVQELGRFVLMRENNICAGGIITGWE